MMDQAELPANYVKSNQIKETVKNIILPKLVGWNSEKPLRQFQMRGVAWMYLAKRCLLADPVGSGKTIQALGLLSLLKTQKQPYRTIVVAQNYQTQVQWLKEILSFTDLMPASVHGEKPERVAQYGKWWDILVTRYSLLLRDYSYLKQLDIDILILDEASYFRHHDTKTARMVKALAKGIDRTILLDATPVQNTLLDIHSLLEALRMNIFGALPAFETKFIRREPVRFRKGHNYIRTSRIVGYHNMKEFKDRIYPFILRRKIGEIEAEYPEIAPPQNIWLSLPPNQSKYYNEAKRGILNLYTAGDRRKMRSSFHHLQYACDTTLSFVNNDLSKAESVKIDWIINHLTHDLKGRKVIIFSKYKIAIEHLMHRLEQVKIKAYRYTGDESKEERDKAIDDFWNDPKTLALVGTTSLERGLNLQKSAHMICLNQMFNPQRQLQLLGRINRMNSEHSKIFFINVLIEGTLEEKMQKLLSSRAALPDYLFDEKTELFDQLSDDELAALLQD